MPFWIPIGLAVGAATAAAAAWALLSDDKEKDPKKPPVDLDYENESDDSGDAHKKEAAKKARAAIKSRRNEMVKQLLQRHNLQLEDRSNLFNRKSPQPLLEAIDNLISAKEAGESETAAMLRAEASEFREFAEKLRTLKTRQE